MTARTPQHYDRTDILAQADQALAATAEHWLRLSRPEMLQAGSTSTGERTDRRATRVHAPIPLNLDVLDFLTLAEAELADLVGEVMGATGGHGDALGDGAVSPPATPLGAVHVLRERLPDVPDPVLAEVAAAVWRLARTGRRIAGDDVVDPARMARARCPSCGRRSVIAHPTKPGHYVCAVRACRAAAQPANDPSPAHE